MKLMHLFLCVAATMLAVPALAAKPAAAAVPAPAADRPNILWLTSEDHSPHMGCYGDKLARTPNVDGLAAKGMIFRRAWSVAPVCAPARTSIISGMYPSSTGGLHMRSMVPMPTGTKMYPELLREGGFYCTNNSKTDYNVRAHGREWDESSGKAHWKNRPDGQPFFAIFNSTKSHESQLRTRPHTQVTDPAKVPLPAYHPDTPEVREDWAQYYDKVSEADADAGKHLQEIEAAGLSADTIVFYFADHGSGMPRSKRWPSNSGLHVPMVVYFPERWQHLAPKEYKAGSASDRMVSFVDLAPTVLSLAAIQPPKWMQGNAFAGTFQSDPQPFLYGERGRMDERMDLVRSVTDGRYVYLRNYFPHVSQAQRVAYQFETPTTRVWHDMFVKGTTNAAQSIFWKVPKASEELFDLQTDPDEVHNLAESSEHQQILEKLRNAQRQHVIDVRDVCFLAEREIHSRSSNSTPYDMARDANQYPFERILAAAESASQMNSANAQSMVSLLEDTDSAVRYWGALGLLMRGMEGVAVGHEALSLALKDNSPDVRIAAAQALGQYGTAADQTQALAALAALTAPQTNGVLTSMSALAAVESLGNKATSLHADIAALNAYGASPDERYNSYVPRLIANIADSATEKLDANPASRKTKRKDRAKAKAAE